MCLGESGWTDWKHPVRPIRQESELLSQHHGAEKQRAGKGTVCLINTRDKHFQSVHVRSVSTFISSRKIFFRNQSDLKFSYALNSILIQVFIIYTRQDVKIRIDALKNTTRPI